ncbi:RNA polymerase sigma factor [Embleya sp. MST-111070]|uniref:RNA polymerase sigma factor n=1 Tax=Embleya sp. MST-111070 TaxID=3398231 RepID=UPI003F7320CA
MSTPQLPSSRLSFQAFHALYAKPWFDYVYLQTANREVARDTVREAFGHLEREWQHALEQESVSAYAWRILKEHVGAWLVANGRVVAIRETAAFAPLARALDLTRDRFALMESRLGLFHALLRLTERQYDVIVLRYVMGCTDAEVAARLGVAESTVRSTVRHAKRRLARELRISERPRTTSGRN